MPVWCTINTQYQPQDRAEYVNLHSVQKGHYFSVMKSEDLNLTSDISEIFEIFNLIH